MWYENLTLPTPLATPNFTGPTPVYDNASKQPVRVLPADVDGDGCTTPKAVAKPGTSLSSHSFFSPGTPLAQYRAVMFVLRFSQRFTAQFRKNLPRVVVLSAFSVCAVAQPDPGPVDGLGRRTDGLDRSIRYILPDPVFEGPRSELHPLLPPSRLRAIEPMRTVREILPEGRLLLRGGRAVAFLGIVLDASPSAAVRENWRIRSAELAGKAVRLVFEQETQNANRELAA